MFKSEVKLIVDGQEAAGSLFHHQSIRVKEQTRRGRGSLSSAERRESNEKKSADDETEQSEEEEEIKCRERQFDCASHPSVFSFCTAQ